jgi:hypothetical protein
MPRKSETEGTTGIADAVAQAAHAEAEWVSIDAIHPWPDNPRKNDGTPVAAVAKSIKRYGWTNPIIARRENGEIIAGHTRRKAAIKLGMDKILVRFLDVGENEAHSLALADNKTAELAEWDETLLRAVTFSLKSKGVDLLIGTGFDQDEIDKLLDPDDTGTDDGEDGGSALGDGLKYSVIVECDGEQEQAMLVDKLEKDGLKCRPLIS